MADSPESSKGTQEPRANFWSAGRRTFLQGAAAAAALTAMPRWAQAHPDDFAVIRAEIEKRTTKP